MTAFDRERRRIERLLADGQMTKREADRRLIAVDRAEAKHAKREERFETRERQMANARLRYRLRQSVEIVWC
jgi:hypothetical protein